MGSQPPEVEEHAPSGIEPVSPGGRGHGSCGPEFDAVRDLGHRVATPEGAQVRRLVWAERMEAGRPAQAPGS